MIKLDKNRVVIINLFLIIVFFGIWLVALTDSKVYESNFSSCIILPLIFLLGNIFILFVKKDKILDIHLIIILLFFFKMYVLPILVIFNNGFDIRQYNFQIQYHILDAVLIQIFEWIAIVIGLAFFKIRNKCTYNFFIKNDSFTNKNVWKIIWFCILLLLICVLKYPFLLNKFRPLFFSSEVDEIIWKKSSTLAMESMPTLLYYPINWLMIITRILLVYMIIIEVWKFRKNTTISVIVSFMIILIGLIFLVPDDVAASIIAAVCLFILITKLYPQKKKQILQIVGISSALLFIYMFFGRAIAPNSSMGGNLNSLIGRINAYFSGFINVSAVFEMHDLNRIHYFFGDFLRSIPIIKGFFVNMPTTTELFNRTLGYDIVYNSQIIPLAGQSFFYFKYIGVIIAPVIVLKICFVFYNKLLCSKGTYDYFINAFYCLIFAFGIVMYDGFLILNLCLTYLPILIINIYKKRKKCE